MRRPRVAAIVAALVIVVGLAGVSTTAGAQSSDEKPKATDVGITDKEIHVAVIADVDNTLAPNLFKGSMDGIEGWAKYINSKAGGGGLAGRKVVIDFYDSKLNPNETKNAKIKACQNDVATVGTSAVFLTSVDEMRNCKDSTGAVTGLPDIPFVSTALVQQCSDQSFPIAPPQVQCDTKRPSTRRRSRRTWPAVATTSTSTARTAPRRLRLRQRLEVGARRFVRQPRWFRDIGGVTSGHQVRRRLRPVRCARRSRSSPRSSRR